MFCRHSRVAQLGRSLLAHLDRLCATLDALSERLRDAVAQALGQTIAGTVQEAVRAVLGESGHAAEVSGGSPWSKAPLASPWGYPEDWSDPDDPDSPWAERGPPEPSSQQPAICLPSTYEPTRWHQALAVGCEAAAWWLRSQFGRLSAWAAVAVGLAAAATARLAGARRTASLLSLLALAQTDHAGATLLSVPAFSLPS
jgi:hypothetical protein